MSPSPLNKRKTKAYFDDLIVQLEPTYLCNLKCIMCAHTYRDKVHGDIQPYMKLSLFKKILNEIVDFCLSNSVSVNTLQLFWYGEPLLHPDIVEMIEYAVVLNQQYNLFKMIKIDTNFIPISHSQIRRIVEICEEYRDNSLRFSFSLDAISPQTYQKIRGGDFNRAMSNIMYLIKMKESYHALSPFMTFQFIIHPFNYNETKGFVDYWMEILRRLKTRTKGNAIYLRKLVYLKQALNHTEKETVKIHQNCIKGANFDSIVEDHFRLIIDRAELTPRQTSGKREPCGSLWKNPSIASNGDLTFCCKDEMLRFKLGNLKHNTFSELWDGKLINELRMAQINGDFNEPEICRDCSGHMFIKISPSEIATYINTVKS